MNTDLNEMFYVAAITGGLLLFTYLLFVSKNRKKRLQDRRDRIKRNWLDRL